MGGRNEKKRRIDQNLVDLTWTGVGIPSSQRNKLYRATFDGWAVRVFDVISDVENDGYHQTKQTMMELELDGRKATDAGTELYFSGFFGKGILSRSQPTFKQRQERERQQVQQQQQQQQGVNSSSSSSNNKKRSRTFHLKHQQHQQHQQGGVEEGCEEGRKRPESESGVIEWLQLGYEEAFYLAFELGWLQIFDYDQTDQPEKKQKHSGPSSSSSTSSSATCSSSFSSTSLSPSSTTEVQSMSWWPSHPLTTPKAEMPSQTITTQKQVWETLLASSSSSSSYTSEAPPIFSFKAKLPSSPMSAEECWKVFSSFEPNFPFRYLAYSHYRRKGWVVRSGLKYGTDFVLYPNGGPTRHHALHSLVVSPHLHTQTSFPSSVASLPPSPSSSSSFPVSVPSSTTSSFSSQFFEQQRLRNWQMLSTLSRVTETVAKDLLYCHVVLLPLASPSESQIPSSSSSSIPLPSTSASATLPFSYEMLLQVSATNSGHSPFPVIPSLSLPTPYASPASSASASTKGEPYVIVERSVVRLTPDRMTLQ